jgi:DNA invertase Pin-like site-specific DNA recombinase
VKLQVEGKGFRCLQENIDTSTSGGKLFFHIIASLAEFERDIIRERTHAGLVAARARGRLGGRPRLLNGRKIQMARALLQDQQNTVKEVCQTLGCSKATLYRYANNQQATGDEWLGLAAFRQTKQHLVGGCLHS